MEILVEILVIMEILVEILVFFMQAFLLLANIIVPFFINTEAILIFLKLFSFFIILHVSRITEESSQSSLK